MIGRTVGQYQIQEQLGSGGMGIVYKAHDTKLDRTVALKFLPPHLSSDETSKKRFIREARAASALDHANICTIHDIDEDEEGKLFIVMSYYDGQTLKYLLDDGPLSVDDAVLIGSQIASGLARAHEAGIVHRDVKPANIMVTARGEVKILDFGIAKLSEMIDLTKTGSTVGTAAYMSPEQAKGEPVNFRSDIWSVGVLMYEMITGRQPFDGTYEAALIYGIVNAAHEPIEAELPDGLDGIIDRCLSKDADDRFQSAIELAQALGMYTQSSSSGVLAAVSGGSGGSKVQAKVQAVVPPEDAATESSFKNGSHKRGTRSPAAVLMAFGIIASAVLGLVYAAMIGLGLPDWVFPLGATLIVIGFPITFLAARNEKNATDSWLTLQKAIWGGVFSMSGLVVVSAAYMIMRIAGIGPAASLQSSGALVENAKLIIADFENKTGDERLAEAVTEALRIDLSQSSVIQLMDKSDLVSVLRRMNRPADSEINIDTAMEIAAREGAEAVIAGEISSLGAGFILSARLIAAHNGEELVALRENAADDSKIIAAVDHLSDRLREKIGESIKEIRSNEDLDQVTTSSLDALRLFSKGLSNQATGDIEEAIELLEQAVEIDPSFAMAYRKLGVLYGNAQRPALSVEAATRAFELRDNLPDREKGLTTAYYYSYVDLQVDRVFEEYEKVLAKYPDEGVALNNVAIGYNYFGNHDLAEKRLRRALEIGNNIVYFNNQLLTLAALGKWEAADSLIDRLKTEHPDHPFTQPLEATSMLDRGSYSQADSIFDHMTPAADPGWEAFNLGLAAQNDVMHGRLRDAGERQSQAENMLIGIEDTLAVFRNLLSGVVIELDALEDANAARQSLSEILSRYPLSSLAVLDRPYNSVIGLYSRLGDTETARNLLNEYHRSVPEGQRKASMFQLTAFFGEAELVAAEGNYDSAADLYAGIKDMGCIYCSVYRSAEMHERAGRSDEALSLYTTASEMALGTDFITSAPLKPLAYLRLGEIYSEHGELNAAIEAYINFVDLWSGADDSLQDQVRYARNRVDQLLKQAAREPQ